MADVNELDVVGVRVEMPSNQPIVLLKESGGERYLPIWIGAGEATAIAFAQQGVVPPRPLTHDLIRDLLEAAGQELTQVRITALRDGVFYAEMVFASGIEVSARPSDAIAVALRTGTPIFGAEEVLAEAGISIPDEQEDEVEKFREFLDQISPEDFAGPGAAVSRRRPGSGSLNLDPRSRLLPTRARRSLTGRRPGRTVRDQNAPACNSSRVIRQRPLGSACGPSPGAETEVGVSDTGARAARPARPGRARSAPGARAGQQGLLFTDDLPELPEDMGYRGPTACSAAGITYRQLDYWARTGLVEPSIRSAAGSGSQRLYSFRDILVLKVVKRLLDTGVSLQNIRTAVAHLRERGVDDLAQITLMSDGASVYECTSADEVVDLVQGGQGVFGIAVGRVWREVEGTLAELPGRAQRRRRGRGADGPTPPGRAVGPPRPAPPADVGVAARRG